MSFGDTSVVFGPSRLFAEHTGSALLTTDLDEYGFLKHSRRFFGFERLLEAQCALVVAPPWVGKSYAAEGINRFLHTERESELLAESYYLRLANLEARLLTEPLEPSWWTKWKSNPEAGATWIIDSLEEGRRREHGALCPALLSRLTALTKPQRERLRLILFARESELRELAPDFEAELRNLFDDVLVADLLLGEEPDHGVFLVGWNGRLAWSRGAGRRPEKTPEALVAALQGQATAFRREHPAIDIRPVVWHLERTEK